MQDRVHDYDDGSPQEFYFTRKKQSYVLREPTGAAARQYRMASLRGTEMDVHGDGESRTMRKLEGIASVESLLVSMCTFQVGVNGGDVPVDIGTVESWEARVQRDLFRRAKEMGGLDEDGDVEELKRQVQRLNKRIKKLEDEEAAKNLRAAGLVGSAPA